MDSSSQHSPLPSRSSPARRGRSPRATKSGSPGRSYVSDPSTKPLGTFTSSLSIAVEGTKPIDKSNMNRPVHLDEPSSPRTNGETRRAPRKSKTDALAALNVRSRSPSSALDEMNPISSTRISPDPATLHVPISIENDFDLSSVKTIGVREPKPRTRSRPFNLEDCPTFYPSPNDFKDPLSYIRQITPEAQKYGICKIVPPSGWKMPFKTDTENFRFKTRLQRLNSIEASSRAKLNFLEALYRYHKQQGNSRVTVPTINHKPLDLWLLRKEVHKLGGFEAVNKGKKWSDLGRILGYGGIPGLSTQLRNSYVRVILPYEHFSDGVRNSPSLKRSREGEKDTLEKSGTPIPGAVANGVNGLSQTTSSRGSPLSITSSPLSEPPDDVDVNGAGPSNFGSPRTRKERNILFSAFGNSEADEREGRLPRRSLSPESVVGRDEIKEKQDELCEICQKQNRADEMLLCDGCDCGFHTFCLAPPLSSIPKGQWYCHTCLSGTGGDFGFDEGEEHSLSTFQERDLHFRRMWFKSHPPRSNKTAEEIDETYTKLDDVVVSEDDVEEEFWRLVQSSSETVEVEYGADVHSTTHGSAMPTLETHPLDAYSKDPWNLNNIPILQESLLRYIKSEISGMTVPWTYVGMIFSTFCWHNEDHYTHSINYMHWGQTKTWYGIPGSDADKFEAAIKKEAPELFESQPDLLFQLVTLMNPERLTEAGVKVYACNQRPNEFVVTFPKAYHAGFNHGFNMNEAVNFAMPDWLPFGRDCVQRYQDHKKPPVFSHDELLITITQQSHTIQTAIWLNESFEEMVNRELTGRAHVRALGALQVIESRDQPEDQYQCAYCKAFCYLSQVTCPCPKEMGPKVVCLDHAKRLCTCPMSQRTLRLRFTDDELKNIQSSLSNRASIPKNWRAKFRRLLSESSRPSLRSMRALVAEADRISYPLKEINWLRLCVNRANEWVEAANSFTMRKQSRKRSKRRFTQNGNGVDDPADRPVKTIEDLHELLYLVDTLGFDCPEIELLRNLRDQAVEFQENAADLLHLYKHDREQFDLSKCKLLLLHGSSINVYLEEVYKLENIVAQDVLCKDLEERDESGITLDEVRNFLALAKQHELPADSKYMKFLEDKLKAGTDWDERAASILSQPVKTIEELDQFLQVESNIPVDHAVFTRIKAVHTRAKDFEKQAKAWLTPEPGASLPRVQDALRLVQRAEKEFSIPAIQDLKRTADFAYDLEDRCEAVLKSRYQHREEGTIFDTMEKWRNYAKEHLTKFILPSFEKLDKQLEAHEQWIKKLPWYCPEHETPHGREILHDVMDYTRLDDDEPPDDEFFTCICFDPVRPPPPGKISDAVQCDHCYARFHGRCAANGGSCPFCDPNHWNGNIHRDRSWHFCYLPTVLDGAPEITRNYSEIWKELEDIVQRVKRLCDVIGRFLAFASQPGNQREEYIPQVRHYMRKLYKIGFAVSLSPEVSFGLDLAGLHRILASRPVPVRLKKRRRPRFLFGQDVDPDWSDGTRCICRGRTPYFHGFAIIPCESCGRRYHAACTCYDGPVNNPVFTCPLCCLKKCKNYRWADVRVKYIKEPDPNYYVDVRACIENYSKDLVRVKLDPPTKSTIFIDLVQFTPGQPDGSSTNGAHSPVPLQPQQYQPPAPPHLPRGAHMHIMPQRPVIPPMSMSPSVPPPPPWTRGDSSGPAPGPGPSTSVIEPAIPFRRKRKHSSMDNDNMIIFEVDSLPSQGAAESSQRTLDNTPALNIIMQNPSQMAAHHANQAQARAARKSSPVRRSSSAQNSWKIGIPSTSSPPLTRQPSTTSLSMHHRPSPAVHAGGVRKVKLLVRNGQTDQPS